VGGLSAPLPLDLVLNKEGKHNGGAPASSSAGVVVNFAVQRRRRFTSGSSAEAEIFVVNDMMDSLR